MSSAVEVGRHSCDEMSLDFLFLLFGIVNGNFVP